MSDGPPDDVRPPPASPDGLQRHGTAWLDDSAVPQRSRRQGRSFDLSAVVPPPGEDEVPGAEAVPRRPPPFGVLDPDSDEYAERGNSATGRDDGQGASVSVGGSSGVDVDLMITPPLSSLASIGGSPEGAVERHLSASSPTMGLRLDVAESPVRETVPDLRLNVGAPPSNMPVLELALPGTSPDTGGDMDELMRFGSSRDVSAFTSDAPPQRQRHLFDSAGFEVIHAASTNPNLAYGMKTPSLFGSGGSSGTTSSGTAANTHKQLGGKRFQSSHGTDDKNMSGAGKGKGGLFGWFGRKSEVKKTAPTKPDVDFTPPPVDATRDFPDVAMKDSPNGDKLWVRSGLKSPVLNWHIGTSSFLSTLPLLVLRLLFLSGLICYVVVVALKLVNASNVPLAIVLSNGTFWVHGALLLFVFIAVFVSLTFLLRPNQDLHKSLFWRITAIIFHGSLVLSASESVRFFLLSSVASLRPTTSGADDIFAFTSVYSQETHVVFMVAFLEFIVNNVPLHATYGLFPFVTSCGLVGARIAADPRTSSYLLGGLSLALSIGFSTLVIVLHGFQRRTYKRGLGKLPDGEYLSGDFDTVVDDDDDDDGVVYESPHFSSRPASSRASRNASPARV